VIVEFLKDVRGKRSDIGCRLPDGSPDLRTWRALPGDRYEVLPDEEAQRRIDAGECRPVKPNEDK
jgi:hypothetical protein